jgi:hypothetical protein
LDVALVRALATLAPLDMKRFELPCFRLCRCLRASSSSLPLSASRCAA